MGRILFISYELKEFDVKILDFSFCELFVET